MEATAKKLTKKQEKALDTEVSRAYYAGCSGIQIPMLAIPAVFRAGRAALAEGKHGDELQAAVRAFVETIVRRGAPT